MRFQVKGVPGSHKIRPGESDLTRYAWPDTETHRRPRNPILRPHACHAGHGEAHASRHAHHLTTRHPQVDQLLGGQHLWAGNGPRWLFRFGRWRRSRCGRCGSWSAIGRRLAAFLLVLVGLRAGGEVLGPVCLLARVVAVRRVPAAVEYRWGKKS